VLRTGWKQIAQHVGYGVRTVQRWEYLGLPVRRMTGGARSPVVADSYLLDEWMRQGAGRGSTRNAWKNVRRARELRQAMEKAREELNLRMEVLRAASSCPIA
jgi:hypothetical protein